MALLDFVDACGGPHRYTRFITISLLVVTALALTITLAVEPEPGADSGQDIANSDSPARARLVFYGPEGGQTDLLGQPVIFVNGVAHGRLVRGTYFDISVLPGPVTACIHDPNHECRTIKAVTGKVYYFKATYPYPRGYALSRIDAITGEAERLLKANSRTPQHLMTK